MGENDYLEPIEDDKALIEEELEYLLKAQL